MIDGRNNGLFTEGKTSENCLKNGRRGGPENSECFISKNGINCLRGQHHFVLLSARLTCVLMIMQALNIRH